MKCFRRDHFVKLKFSNFNFFSLFLIFFLKKYNKKEVENNNNEQIQSMCFRIYKKW